MNQESSTSPEPPKRPRWKLDPELAAISVLIPTFDLDRPEEARSLERALSTASRDLAPGVLIEDHSLDLDGRRIPIRTYRPAEGGRLPALLYIHGGAFVIGGLDTEDDRCSWYARSARCVVFAVDYRLAPENPFPAGFEDCYETLRWLFAEADELGIDPARVAVGGNSAGGALAAAVALHSRLSPLPRLAHLILINPALDCRSETNSMLRFTDTPSFTRSQNMKMWDLYLGGAVPDYRAAPALAEDVRGMPSTSIWIAEIDPLRDEAYEFVARLLDAGTPVSVFQRAGSIHGFDGYRMTLSGQRAHDEQVEALVRAFRSETL